MRLLLFLTAIAAGVAAAQNPAAVTDTPVADFCPYLGLAVPVPDTIPALTASPAPAPHVANGEYALTLVVDKKGRVKKLRYPSDSANCYRPVEAVYKQIHFRFLSGTKIGSTVIVPALLCYANEGAKERKVSLRFPISTEMISDGPLLTRLFAENKVSPPEITSISPIYYRLPTGQKPSDCRTITARVSLDAQGMLEDMEFPFPGGEGMTHPIQAALIHATYAPARKKGKPLPCDFFVTFRIFDNLRYPYAPFGPADSARPTPMTGKYFMTIYYNDRDISLFPLPRSFAAGVIGAGVFPRGVTGRLQGEIMISPEGSVGRVVINGSQAGQEDVARRALQLTEWYPARNNRGEAVWFSGRVTVVLDGTSNVVYIPEWIAR